MKIALAQMRVKQGRVEDNFKKLALLAKEAKKLGADLAAFPEMCLSGYLMGDSWTQEEFVCELLSYNDKICDLSKETGIIIVYGNIAADESFAGNPSAACKDAFAKGKNEDGRSKKYNAVYLVQNGKTHIRKKSLLPNYRMFDDKRYFSAGTQEDCQTVILENGEKIGLEVCEDLWHADYAFNPTQKLTPQGADFIINVSSSPFSVGKSKARDNRIKELKNLLGENFVPFYYVNCVGAQNNGKSIVTFDGDSRIYNRNGDRQCANYAKIYSVQTNKNGEIKFETSSALELAPYQEGLIVAQNSSNAVFDAQENSNCKVNYNFKSLTGAEQKFLAIQEAYKSMDELFGDQKYVFGLSGGIDSALNLVLCSLALGKEKILAYNLPSRYNCAATKQAASKLCSNLGIGLNIIPIDNIADAFINALGEINSITRENLQARIRTVILMAQTSQHNAVLINNTNKVELALGYGTLYGDLAGAWCPIGDLLKTEIWELSRYVNKMFGKIIPEELIPDENLQFDKNQIRPSAELKENQTDPMIWGFDDWLLEQFMDYNKKTPEKILRLYKDGALKELCAKYNLDGAEKFIAHLQWFFEKLYSNVFKRIQAPPVLVLSKSAFGGDYRESQYKYEPSQNYLKLKEEILKG